MTTVPDIIYSLKCGHAAIAPSTLVNGMLYCGEHQDYSPIAGVVIHEWRASCSTCRFARWAGMSESTASQFANGHLRRNNGHSCHPEYVVNPAAVATATKLREWLGRGQVRS